MPRVFGRSLARARSASALIALATPFVAYAQVQTYAFNIPADDLGTALRSFARQAHQQVAFDGALVAGKKSASVVGTYAAADAIRALLEGTGLSAHIGSKGEFLVTASRSDITDASSTTQPERRTELEEVIVTAQKREERLQDVPVPVTVLDTSQLAVNNETRLLDYFDQVPGLTAYAGTSNFGLTPNLAIRGIAPVGGGPTVGVVIDDIPFDVTAGYQAGDFPDVDPADLSHIEVLRGPQGTLYGADSLGGLVKIVTRDPDLDSYSGRLEAGTSEIYNGAAPGSVFRAAANIPLGNDIAIRASGFTQQQPGYIDNPFLHINGINQGDREGGRLSLLWKPADTLSIKLSALYQAFKQNGLDDADVPTPSFPQYDGLGPLKQNYIAGAGARALYTQLYDAVIKWKVGAFDVTSLTGYGVNHASFSLDIGGSGGAAQVAAAYPGQNIIGEPYYEVDDETKFSQELRAATSLGKWVDVMVGVFYTHENSNARFDIYGQNSNGQLVQDYYYYRQPVNTLDEYAGFGSATLNVTSKFNIEVGVREAGYRQELGQIFQAGVGSPGGGPSIQAAETGNNSAFTYSVAPKYSITPDVMVYARAASGYRIGSPNVAFPGVPRSSNPDNVQDFEVGLKGDFLERKLSIDASIYYINWKDIQIMLLTTTNPTFAYNTNAGEAKSEGTELSVTVRPIEGLSLSGWMDYDDAAITKPFPFAQSGIYAVPGDPLPFASRWSGSLAINDEFPVMSATGFVGAVASFVGDRKDAFTSASTRLQYPAYTKLNLNAGIKYGPWTTTIYANNVTNVLGILNADVSVSPGSRVYITPRTIGVDVTKTF